MQTILPLFIAGFIVRVQNSQASMESTTLNRTKTCLLLTCIIPMLQLKLNASFSTRLECLNMLNITPICIYGGPYPISGQS